MRVALLALVLAISGGAPVSAEMALTEKDDGRTITVKRGDALTVRLPVSLGTGYGWSRIDADEALVAEEPRVESSTTSLPGGSEIEVFRFTARKVGRTAIALRYGPSWEDVPHARTYRVHVEITEPAQSP